VLLQLPSQQQQQQQQQEPAQHMCFVLTSVMPTAPQPPQQQQQQQQQAVSWLEVPPGIYSITVQAMSHLLNSNNPDSSTSTSTTTSSSTSSMGHTAAAVGTPASAAVAPVSSSDGFLPAHMRPAGTTAAEDTAGNQGVNIPCHLCAALPGLQHHRWADAQLLQLQQYNRSAGIVPQVQTAAAANACQQQQEQAQRQRQQQSQEPELQSAQQELQQLDLLASSLAPQQLLQVMQAAVDVRCLTINSLHQQQQHPEQQDTASIQATPAPAPAAAAAAGQLPPAPVLILFSGGVDSTLIAALAHRSLPPGVPIDLSNVCFDSGRSADRAAARAALLELAAYAPDRAWRLIEVDSSLQEVDHIAQHIRALLHPAATVMDWNIGSALWLAAKAEGQVWVPTRQPGSQPPQQLQQQGGAAAAQGWLLEPWTAAAADEDKAGSAVPAAGQSRAQHGLAEHQQEPQQEQPRQQ
jgi:hypothetical protein